MARFEFLRRVGVVHACLDGCLVTAIRYSKPGFTCKGAGHSNRRPLAADKMPMMCMRAQLCGVPWSSARVASHATWRMPA